MNYIKNIWITRYFWINLALSDIRSKWRRSFFGVLWTIIQPLGMTILLSVVFSKIFNTDATSYAPYILSGMIVWEFITQALMSGSMSFIQADAYIKQYKTPLAIYTLRAILTNLITLLLASISLITWALITNPQNFNYSWFAAFLIYPILLLISWPLSTILAYLTARFRDIPYALTLALQAVWFISPVYIQDTVFRSSGLNSLIDYNPIYHLLEIVRAPILRGSFPTIENFTYCIIVIGIFFLTAFLCGRQLERKVIFYL